MCQSSCGFHRRRSSWEFGTLGIPAPGPDRLPRVSFRDKVFETAAIQGEKNFKNISAGKAAVNSPRFIQLKGPNFDKGSCYSCQAWTISKRLII